MKKTAVFAAAIAAAGFVNFASAADMPVKAPAVVAPVYNWTGFYVGADAGYLWSTAQWFIPPGGGFSADSDPRGFKIGGDVGYRYQFSSGLVLGVEGDFSWINADRTAPVISVATGLPDGNGGNIKLKWDASARGVAGYAMNRSLLYVTGGVSFINFSGCNTNGVGGPCFATTTFSGTHTGWTAGLGYGYAVTNNLIARIEYLHADYGAPSYQVNFLASVNNFKTDTVRAGVEWKFGP